MIRLALLIVSLIAAGLVAHEVYVRGYTKAYTDLAPILVQGSQKPLPQVPEIDEEDFVTLWSLSSN